MKNKNSSNFILYVLFIITIVLVILLYMEKKNTSELEKPMATLPAKTEKSVPAAEGNVPGLNDPQMISKLQSWDIRRFQKRGLANPEEDIVNDLLKQNRLIQFDSHAGVNWRIDKNETIILSNKWVFTKFDDGHMLGSILLQYQVENGIITWEVISQYLD
jgi:hypothetical protein